MLNKQFPSEREIRTPIEPLPLSDTHYSKTESICIRTTDWAFKVARTLLAISLFHHEAAATHTLYTYIALQIFTNSSQNLSKTVQFHFQLNFEKHKIYVFHTMRKSLQTSSKWLSYASSIYWHICWDWCYLICVLQLT